MWIGQYFPFFLYWRAHCTAIQVQADEQLWSSWHWLWNHNCHKLVKLDPYLVAFSSLLSQFCHDRKSQPPCLAPSLFCLATYLGWTACHQSDIWYEYRHLKPEDHLKMEKSMVIKVGTSPQPCFTLSLADTVQKPVHNFGSLHACHHGVVVPLVWTLVDSQTLSWFSSHDWLVRSTKVISGSICCFWHFGIANDSKETLYDYHILADCLSDLTTMGLPPFSTCSQTICIFSAIGWTPALYIPAGIASDPGVLPDDSCLIACID